MHQFQSTEHLSSFVQVDAGQTLVNATCDDQAPLTVGDIEHEQYNTLTLCMCLHMQNYIHSDLRCKLVLQAAIGSSHNSA